MSYDIDYINEKGKRFELDEPLKEGGTMMVGGNTDTHLNITYNYSWYYYKYVDEKSGIRWLYNKKGKDCIEKLEKAIKPFKGYKPYERDYWADTPGNCVKPLKILLKWCKKYPEGTFKGD